MLPLLLASPACVRDLPPSVQLPLANARIQVDGDQYPEIGQVLVAGDLDGDGADELVLGAENALGGAGRAYVLQDLVAADPATTLTATGSLHDESYTSEGGNHAGAALAIGDLDGDHAPELVVSGPTDGFVETGGYVATWPSGVVWVLRGPLGGDVDLATVPDRVVGHEESWTGDVVAVTADADGDDAADLWVGASGEQRLYLMGGPIVGAVSVDAASAQIDAPVSSFSPADFDGDGLADVVLGRAGGAAVWRGPFAGGATVADAAATYVEESSDGWGAVAHGDIDGDGHLDLLVGLASPRVGSHASVVLGPLEGERGARDAEALLASTFRDDDAGASVACGDFDGDGLDDALVGAPADNSYGGAAHLLYGPVRGTILLGTGGVKFAGDPSGNPLRAGSTVGVGDLDGDGLDDVLVGAPAWETDAGMVYGFPGASL